MPGRAPIAALRSACARRSAASMRFADTATNVNTRHQRAQSGAAGTCPTSASRSRGAAAASTIVLNNNGQTSGQITAQAAFSNAVSLLNSQSGDRYLFSGRATDTAATVPADVMLNGTGTQAGLKQLINERRQADQGVGTWGISRSSSPPATTTVTSLAEDGSSVRLEARRDHLVADRRDRDAADRHAAGGDDRSRRRQSERWRQDHIQFQSARRHERDDHADRDHDEPAAGRFVPDRRRYRCDDGEPAGRVDDLDPDAWRYLAGGGLGDSRVG